MTKVGWRHLVLTEEALARNVPRRKTERQGEGLTGKQKDVSWGEVLVLNRCVGDNTTDSPYQRTDILLVQVKGLSLDLSTCQFFRFFNWQLAHYYVYNQ